MQKVLQFLSIQRLNGKTTNFFDFFFHFEPVSPTNVGLMNFHNKSLGTKALIVSLLRTICKKDEKPVPLPKKKTRNMRHVLKFVERARFLAFQKNSPGEEYHYREAEQSSRKNGCPCEKSLANCLQPEL